jgi:type I restriction enzyme S subunit
LRSPFNEAKYKALLEGLEITILYKSEAFKPFFKARIDPEFFQKYYIKLHKTITKGTSEFISNLAFITDGEHGNAQTYPEGYSKYYGARNVLQGILNDNGVEYITKEHHDKLKKTALKPRDILISCVGANIGYAAIVPDTIGIGNIVRNVALIRSTSSTRNEFLLAYFQSKYGRDLYIRMNTGNAQPLVSLDYIKTIPVFIGSETLQNAISDLVSKSLYLNNQSLIVYHKAELDLLKEIGLLGFKPNNDSINIKSFNESLLQNGRLDSEYYQKKYEDYERLIKKGKYTYIKNEYLHIKTVPNKKESGYTYIEIGDINVGDGTYKSNYLNYEDLPANAKTIVQVGDILISKVRPYRGAVTIINTEEENLIVSGAFTVLRKNKKSIFNNEVLKVLLRSDIYKDWLLKFNVGTSYPVIKDDDVLNMPIPFIDESLQKKISVLINESFELKNESERLLYVAKKSLENAIEESEEIAMKYIKTNS